MHKAKMWLGIVAVMLLGFGARAEKQAPGFELPDVQGKTYKLADNLGKIVVLEWTNYDCPFVKKFYTAGAMQELQREAVARGVVWLSICSSAPGKQGHFERDEWLRRMQSAKVAVPVLLDPDGKVGRAYGAKTTPHMFVIDAEGRLVYQGGIDDQPSARAQSLEGARNYVREALQALWDGQPVPLAEAKPYGCSVKY
ncbi:MAG: thioredoxin family protein [Kiritimatiellia bacterium]|nr:thioredoxin family protein [Lentisphaerota bacterium]